MPVARLGVIGRCLAVAACAGCGADAGPFQYIPVHGKVTYEDGSTIPAPGIVLQFRSQDAKPVNGMVPRVANASVGEDGVFSAATSYKYGDGLIPGKHKVAFMYATDAAGKYVVPQDYASMATSPLIVDTGDGNIEIKVPKP